MTRSDQENPQSRPSRPTLPALLILFLLTALGSSGIAALLINIFERKQEALDPYVKLVDVSEDTTDPAPWGMNWPRQYDGYRRTAEPSRTSFGGGDAPIPQEKAEAFPWLTRMFAGYAFALDYRDRRGHAFMLQDQEKTRRVTERPQPGSCLHCHASVMPLYRDLGEGDVFAGLEKTRSLSYDKAHELLVAGGHAHPVSCVDCHDPQTMNLRVTRPGFITGVRALATSDAPVPHLPSIDRWRSGPRSQPYEPNQDATRQEMRSYVCAQCHVEYYCGPKTTLFFPWSRGLKVEEIEAQYDGMQLEEHRFFDWKHAETGAELLKAQHPEFELWSQGIHARSGVACADCHMPYERQGAMKVSDHWVRSPLLQVNRACQTCHRIPEQEIQGRVAQIQQRHHDLLQRAGSALTDLLDAVRSARSEGAGDEQLTRALELQRQAQWRLDFVAAENSMGFHAPQEAARILAESIDLSRQGERAALRWRTPVVATPEAGGGPAL